MMWNFKKYSDSIAAKDEYGNILLYKDLYLFSQKINEICGRTLCFIISQNSIGSLAGYAAMIQGSTVPVMIGENLDKELFQSLLKTYEPEFIWLPNDISTNVENTCEMINQFGYRLLRTKYDKKDDINSELALLLTTSGSTGSPKLVRQSYNNIKSNTESIVEYLNLDSTERPITTLPMNYTYGLSIINSHLYVGATILLTDKTLMQKEFWDYFKTENATSFGGVPYTYEILKKLRFSRMILPSLRYMTQAGGKLSPELHKVFAQDCLEKNRKFIVMYGQTEATARMAYLPSEFALEKYGSMGIAIPGGCFSLIDDNGAEITEDNITGELIYKGANVTLGYAETRKDLIKGDENHGVLFTGDMAQKDKDGFYYIVGRKKRFLKMFGKRVNLDEIERIIKSRFNSLDCACDGKDDNMYIFVTDNFILDEVRGFISNKTGINISAINTVYLQQIPRNESGKIMYTGLNQYYEK